MKKILKFRLAGSELIFFGKKISYKNFLPGEEDFEKKFGLNLS